mgnify:CR=1 FL=1
MIKASKQMISVTCCCRMSREHMQHASQLLPWNQSMFLVHNHACNIWHDAKSESQTKVGSLSCRKLSANLKFNSPKTWCKKSSHTSQMQICQIAELVASHSWWTGKLVPVGFAIDTIIQFRTILAWWFANSAHSTLAFTPLLDCHNFFWVCDGTNVQKHTSAKLCPPVLANGTCSQHACFTEGPSIDKTHRPKGWCVELGNWPIEVQLGSTNSKGLPVLFQGSHPGLLPNN